MFSSSRFIWILFLILIFSQTSAVERYIPSKKIFKGEIEGHPLLGDGYGTTVRVNDHFVVVAAPQAQPNEAEGAGAVYIYTKNNKRRWEINQTISPLGSSDRIGGFQVDLEDNILLLSATGTPLGPIPNETVDNQDFSGAILVYKLNRRQGEGIQWWNLVQTIDRFTPGLEDLTLAGPTALRSNGPVTEHQQGAHFGLQMHYDKKMGLLLVGAQYQKGEDANGHHLKNAGAVFAFKHCKKTGKFVFLQKITNPEGCRENDTFGANVRIHGNYALISNFPIFAAPRMDSNGTVFLYHYENKKWKCIQRLHGDQKGPTKIITAYGAEKVGDGFGSSLALNDHFAIIGAGLESRNHERPLSGAVYFYKFKHKTLGKHLEFKQKEFSDDKSVQGTALMHVDLQGDVALVSDPLHTGPKGQKHQGGALFFVRNKDKWKLKKVLFDPHGKEYDYFGYSVALDRESAVVGTGSYGVMPLSRFVTMPLQMEKPVNKGKVLFFKKR